MNNSLIDIPSYFYNKFSDKSRLIFFKEYEDSVKWLLQYINSPKDKIAIWRLIEVFKDLSIWYSFHSEIENIKKWLTTQEKINSEFTMFQNQFSDELNQNQFNELIHEEVKKIEWALKEILNISWLKSIDIDKIIMNWWTSFIPWIKLMVENIIWSWKILKGNTLSSVWYWLTLESYDIFK